MLDVSQRPYDPMLPVVCLDETSRQLLAEPLRGWRHVTVGAQRTRREFAHCIKELVDIHYPDAERIVLVMDQLNTHTPASWRSITPRNMGVG
ncbi:MAG: hypothetical protein ACR2OU_19150 [Thermomicrobiales bacterium]